MSRYIKKNARKRARADSGPAHAKAPASESARFFVTRISPGRYEQIQTSSVKDCAPDPHDTITWVCMNDARDEHEISKIGNLFHIHHLTIEDILNTDHITKLDILKDYTFILMKSLNHPGDGNPISQQMSFVLGSNFIVSFLEGGDDLFKPLRDRLKLEHERFLAMGPGYLAYSLMDLALDRYFEVLEFIDDEIYQLEEETTSYRTDENLNKIQMLRRKVIMVRRAAWPLRDVINNLHHRDNFIKGESTALYLNDIYDHVAQIIDTTETFREVLSNIFDIYLTRSGNRINEVMKVLTIITTVVMPMTVITGLYGMNFRHMPELRWTFGYPMALGMMGLVGAGMLWFFKKKNWL